MTRNGSTLLRTEGCGPVIGLSLSVAIDFFPVQTRIVHRQVLVYFAAPAFFTRPQAANAPVLPYLAAKGELEYEMRIKDNCSYVIADTNGRSIVLWYGTGRLISGSWSEHKNAMPNGFEFGVAMGTFKC